MFVSKVFMVLTFFVASGLTNTLVDSPEQIDPDCVDRFVSA